MAAFQNNVHNIIAIIFTVTVSCPTLQKGKGQGPTQQSCSRNSSPLPPATSHTAHLRGTQSADMHVTDAGKLTMAIPRKCGILTSMRLSKAQYYA